MPVRPRSSFLPVSAILLGAGAASCGAAPPASAPGIDANIPAAMVIPLTFRAPLFRSVLGTRLSVPMVEAYVNGAPTLLVVDSGSSHHVLTRAFASELRLALGDCHAAGKGHAGEAVTTCGLPAFDLELGDVDISVRGALAVDADGMLDNLGIGGFISPQRLLADGSVILDFPGERLVLLPGVTPRDAASSLGSEESGISSVRVPRRTDLEGEDNEIVVEVALDGRPPISAQLDTGASRTELPAGYVGVEVPIEESVGRSVSGASSRGRVIAGQRLRFAGWTFSDVSVIARAPAGDAAPSLGESKLGMDLLRHALVVLPARDEGEMVVAFRR